MYTSTGNKDLIMCKCPKYIGQYMKIKKKWKWKHVMLFKKNENMLWNQLNLIAPIKVQKQKSETYITNSKLLIQIQERVIKDWNQIDLIELKH